MFLSLCRHARKKGRVILVECESYLTGHKIEKLRDRLGDKLEFVQKDPLMNELSLYRETKKIKTIRQN
ncbi:hypothetical protein SNEBB_002618 [Seison nebaliae]|nr:hypothetical protein SNEBB_002618 [Seison nebaliae]